MLKLKKKTAVLGVINNRIEKHGDNDVTAFDIPITILLNPDEHDEFLGEKSHDRHFKKASRSYEPANPQFGEIPLREHLEDQDVILHFEKSEIEFDKARIKGPTVEFLQGGETCFRGKLQVNPKNQHLTRLLDAQNCQVKFSIAPAKAAKEAKDSAQGTLPLSNVKGKADNGTESAQAAH